MSTRGSDVQALGVLASGKRRREPAQHREAPVIRESRAAGDLKWIRALLLSTAVVVLPLAASPLGDRAYVLPKALLLRGLGLAALLLWILTAIASLKRGHQPLTFQRLVGRFWPELGLALWLATVAVSTIFSAQPGRSVWGSYERMEGLVTLGCYGSLFLVARGLPGVGREGSRHLATDGILTWILVASVPISLLAVAEPLGIHLFPIFQGYDQYEIRSTATFGSPTVLGIYLAMVLPLVLSRLTWDGSVAGRLRLLWLLPLAADVGALMTSLSRGAWLGALAGILAWVIANWRLNAKAMDRRGVVGIAGTAGVVLVIAVTGVLGPIEAKMATLLDVSGGTGAVRLLVWKAASQAIAAHPWLGYGPDVLTPVFERYLSPAITPIEGAWSQFDRAHNLLLDEGMSFGFVGLTALLALIATILFLSIRSMRKSDDPLCRERIVVLISMLVGYLVSVQTEFGDLATNALFWILLGLLAREVHAREPVNFVPNMTSRLISPAILTAGLLVGSASLLPNLIADLTFGRAWQETLAGNLEAFPTFKQLLAMDPSEPHYKAAFADVLVGTARAGQLQPRAEVERAIALLSQAIGLDRDNSLLYEKRGEAEALDLTLAGAGGTQPSEADFSHSVALSPNRGVYYQRWAEARLASHRTGARPLLEKAIALEVRDPQLDAELRSIPEGH